MTVASPPLWGGRRWHFARPGTDRPLAVLAALLDRLHAEGIRYCHWKSNEHLHASMQGTTDLDLLVERSAAAALARVLAQEDCKRFVVRPGRGYPGVEDYLAFDRASGTLVHLHVHYQLTLGERFLKGYRLPWEEVLLATRVWDEQHGLYVAEPAAELLLLVVRAALKLRLRDRALSMLGRDPMRGHALRELRWLAERTRPDRLHELSRPLIGDRAAHLLVELSTATPTLSRLHTFRRCAEPALREYRLYGAARARWLRWRNEASALAGIAAVALRFAPRSSTRTSPHGGLTVALVGIGAETTPLCRALADWLAWEMAVVPLLASGALRQGAIRAWRERSRGRVVILDGGPQRENPWLAERHPPDVVVELHLTPEVAVARRPDVPAEQLPRQAAETLDRPRYAQRARVIQVDASRPADEVLLLVKRIIWDSL